jgi:uncharacterized protein (TIGR03437 family)
MVLAAVLAGLFCAQTASAQNIAIVSGNGQLICQQCLAFAPLMVRVTDSNGVPQANVAVSWAITSGGFGGGLISGATTITAYDGTAYNSYVYMSSPPQGSPFQQYAQTTVTASLGSAAVAFSLSQALYDPVNPLYPAITVTVPSGGLLQSLLLGSPLTGQAGSTGSTPIQVSVAASRGGGVANVSVQLVNYQDPSTGPVVNCQGSAGGEANTVLTDASGMATCSPVFSGIPGTGTFYVLVGAGGVAQSTDPTVPPPFANYYTGNLHLTVTAAQPGLIRVTQGNGQSAAPGQTLSPLQVEVDTALGIPVAGQAVNWTVSPAGAVNFSGSTLTLTDASGHSTVTPTLSGTAVGAVQITATCPACPANQRSVTFSIQAVPIVSVSGVQIVSGNNQTAIVNTTFSLPLVVQVNGSNGQPAASATVQFSVAGPASLSSSSVLTDSTGRAQVSVTAGGVAGAVTVTATVSSFTQSFTLTVAPAAPPAPTLTASNFYNGADFQAGSISPCSIATIIAPGLAPGIQGVVTPGSLFGPLPYVLASDSVSFNGAPAPIFNVANVSGQTPQITVQVPCEAVPGSSVPVTVTVGAGTATVNVPVLAASPGIFQTTMSDGVLRAVAVRPDGSWVTLSNPARRGEIVRAYATGLGVTAPVVGTNATAIPGTDAIVQGALIMGVTNTAGQGEGVRVSTARVAPDLIGVFEIPFLVPADAATGSNVSFSIGVIPVGSSTPIYSATAKIPIQ